MGDVAQFLAEQRKAPRGTQRGARQRRAIGGMYLRTLAHGVADGSGDETPVGDGSPEVSGLPAVLGVRDRRAEGTPTVPEKGHEGQGRERGLGERERRADADERGGNGDKDA